MSKKISGIYQIVNKKNGKKYVGSSKNIDRRLNCHIYNLRKDIHPNPHLQRAWNKYGEKCFAFEIIEENPLKGLRALEQWYLDNYIDFPNDYNIDRSVHGFYPTISSKELSTLSKIENVWDGVNHVVTDINLSKINIFDNEKMNSIGDGKSSLSFSWFSRAKEKDITKLRNNTINFARHYSNSKAENFIWTTYSIFKNLVVGRKLNKKSFRDDSQTPIKERKKKTGVAFLQNVIISNQYRYIFTDNGITLDPDIYSLNRLLKWLENSALYWDKEIDLYIPSERMRTLLSDYIERR